MLFLAFRGTLFAMRILVFLGVCLVTPYTFAQPSSQPSSQPDTAPSSLPLPSPSAPLEHALAHFAAGDFTRAEALLVKYLKSESPVPIAYYYLGRCREANDDKKGALLAYQQFLKISPSAPEAPRLRLKVTELSELPKPAALPKKAKAPAVEQIIENEEPVRPPKRREGLRSHTPQAKIGHMLIGLGSMGAVTGLMFASLAEGRERLLESAGAFAPGFEPVEFDENFQALYQQGERFQKTARITLASSAAAVLGGVLLALTAKPGRREKRAYSFTLSPSPGGVFVGIRGAL